MVNEIVWITRQAGSCADYCNPTIRESVLDNAGYWIFDTLQEGWQELPDCGAR